MTPQDKKNLASDYVLGTLDAAGQAQAEALMASDEAFARDVEQWRQRLSALDMTAQPMAPGPLHWSRIENALERGNEMDAPAPSRAAGLWHSLTAWRAFGLAAATASVLLAAALGFAVREAQRTPAMIAVLVDGDRAGAVVQVFNDGRAVLLPLTDIAVPNDRSLQVWTLPSRERGPVSVGLMDQVRTLSLAVKDLPATRGDQLFEITLEPKGGSPTGRPTGPILYKGLASPTL